MSEEGLRIGWAGLTQRAWLRTETNWHDTEYQDPSLGSGKQSRYYWKIAVVASTYKGRKGLQILGI
jgi:hypothetical protein